MQATEDEIAHSWAGNWLPDVLFELKQVLATYDFLQQQVADCDVQLEKEMQAQPPRSFPVEARAAAVPLGARHLWRASEKEGTGQAQEGREKSAGL